MRRALTSQLPAWPRPAFRFRASSPAWCVVCRSRPSAAFCRTASASSISFISLQGEFALGGVILGGPTQREHRVCPGGFGLGPLGVLDGLAVPGFRVRHVFLQQFLEPAWVTEVAERNPQQHTVLEHRRVHGRVVGPLGDGVHPGRGDLVEPAATGAFVALDARGHQSQHLELLQLGVDLAVGRTPVDRGRRSSRSTF